MIAATELRIGNYFETNAGELVFVSGITYEYIQFERYEINPFSLKYDRFKPIPLTEDWLMRFGFTKGFTGYIKGMPGSSYNFIVIIWPTKIITATVSEYDKEIKYVHQLQNLYFALTGEELKLKES